MMNSLLELINLRLLWVISPVAMAIAWTMLVYAQSDLSDPWQF